MPQPPRDEADSGLIELSTAARELLQTAGQLRSWRSESSSSEIGRLEALQGLLTRIDAVDMDASRTRRAVEEMGTLASNQRAIDDYERALQQTLGEIGELEQLLEAERTRLSPRVDSATRESEARSAYARSLSRT
jgi:hypothetical protein